jgi:hypothetical protein
LIDGGASRNRIKDHDTFESDAQTSKITNRKADFANKRSVRDYDIEHKKITASAQMLDKVEIKVFEDVKHR